MSSKTISFTDVHSLILILIFAGYVTYINMSLKFHHRRYEAKPSMRRKLLYSFGSLAAILLVSSVISVLEYRRMSDYVSELIASNIKSINLSQRLADITQEYDQQMLSAVVMNDLSLVPDFDINHFQDQADSLKTSITSEKTLPMVDSVSVSFNSFMQTSLKFEEVFLADTVNTGEWFFGSLQPCYQKFRVDIDNLNEAIHEELKNNSSDFDEGFYRSIMPGVVSVGAGLLLVMLLAYFIMSFYVNPIYKMSAGLDNYRQLGRRYGYTFEGDDQLSGINTGITELVEENIELKNRIRFLREDKEK